MNNQKEDENFINRNRNISKQGTEWIFHRVIKFSTVNRAKLGDLREQYKQNFCKVDDIEIRHLRFEKFHFTASLLTRRR